MEARKIIVKQLKLFEPALIKKPFKSGSKDKISYSIKQNDDFLAPEFNHFPITLNADGSPWKQANLYLLSKLKDFKLPSHKTLASIANDLVAFKRFVDNEHIHYLSSPKRKINRPTIRYRFHLQDEINSGKQAIATAKRKMQNIIGFYRWLMTAQKIVFEFPLWNESEVFVSFKNSYGFSGSKKVSTTDISIKCPTQPQTYSEYLNDGGQLKPYNKAEQEAIIQALITIGNTEMTLAFLIALTTGVRIQTVFTLREKHITQNISSSVNEIPILIGRGTGIDSKNQKNYTIFLSAWLNEKINIYLSSERRKRRLNNAKSITEKENAYLFITKDGNPYYMAENDIHRTKYLNPPAGNSVRQFIKNQLEIQLAKQGDVLSVKFHNLRASYGMNLVEFHLKNVNDGSIPLFKVLKFVMERMGHNSIETTEQYLNYKMNSQILLSTQKEFEKYLHDTIGFESL